MTTKVRMFLGIAVAVGIMTASAAPAFATFATNNGTSKGSAKALTEALFEGGGGVIKCPAAGFVAEWTNQAAGTVGNQSPANNGPHNAILIKWPANCTAEVGLITATPVIKECKVQLAQAAGSFSPTGSVETECVIKVSVCEVKVPVANETTGSNFNLASTTLANSGKNLKIVSAINGVTMVASGLVCPITSNKAAKLKVSFEEEDNKAV